ncbi:multidrug efflux SMR transporter [Gryllotalpicola koreensis]|uniref:QacE family quaternary ammonium compound efflux SMR transporter n=1 Tax=Gryllotalpicola koreensis TaxID=993086 RepID=A0ABP7ZUH5_9MICO
MRRWLLLAGAIVSEVSGSLSLEGAIHHPWLYAVVAAGYLLSFWLFGQVLRAGMPVGVGYAIWGAIGVALTAVFSAVLFDEQLTMLTVIGMAVVIGGVVLINLGGGHGNGADPGETDAVARDAS